MEIILAIGIFQIIGTLHFFVRKKDKRSSDNIITVLLLLFLVQFTIEMLKFFIPDSTAVFLLSKGNFPLLFSPLLYLYTLHETDPSKSPQIRYLLHIIPFFVVFLLFIIPFFPDFNYKEVVDIEKARYIDPLSFLPKHMLHRGQFPPDFNPLDSGVQKLKHIPPLPLNLLLMQITTLVSVLSYMILSVIRLQKFKNSVQDFYSHTNYQITLKWLRYICYAYILIFLYTAFLPMSIVFLPRHPLLHPQLSYFAGSLIFLHFFSMFAVKQPLLKEIGGDNRKKVRYAKSGLDESQARRYITEIEHYMQEEKPYLNGELTISEVSEALDIPRHHITQVINSIKGTNFYNYVNEYRVKEAIQHLSAEDERSILDIAMDSGFNSKSVFNTFFKKNTGLTPSQYRLEHQL